jgi:hypothetical protein
MPWTWKQIEQDWLLDGRVAPDPSIVVEAFERVEATFGRDWIEESRTLPTVAPKGTPPQTTIDRGAYPVLTVVKMGALLTSLEGIPDTDALIGSFAAASVQPPQKPRPSTCFDNIPPTARLSLSPWSPSRGDLKEGRLSCSPEQRSLDLCRSQRH